MSRINEKSKSTRQRNLMGWAYSCASKGELEDCPPNIRKVAKSFMKKGKKKGLKNLRDFATTKHKGLPNRIAKFEQFINESSVSVGEHKNREDIELMDAIDMGSVNFLKSLDYENINSLLKKLENNKSTNKKELIEDILVEVGDMIYDKTYHWIEDDLKKLIK